VAFSSCTLPWRRWERSEFLWGYKLIALHSILSSRHGLDFVFHAEGKEAVPTDILQALEEAPDTPEFEQGIRTFKLGTVEAWHSSR